MARMIRAEPDDGIEKFNIAPRGNVCLVTTVPTLNDNGKNKDIEKDKPQAKRIGYIVSSSVLSMASKVFASLFDAHVPKGTAFEDRIVIIAVPEEPTGMKMMLEFLHFCPRPEWMSFESLQLLAVVVARYKVQHVFTNQATTWMKQCLEDKALSYDFPKYLGLAVLFKSSDVVNIMSIGLALTTGGRWNDETVRRRIEKTPLGRFVPNEIISEIPLCTCYCDEQQDTDIHPQTTQRA